MNEIRMLTYSNQDDCKQFAEILEDYVRTETEKINQVYVVDHLKKFANWIYDQFLKQYPEDFVVYGSFNDGELIQIMVAYKFEVAWGFEFIMNNCPYWYVGLAYFKDKAWRNPGAELINLGLCLGKHFERQGYYKFYTVKKMPRGIRNYEDMERYINSSAFKETYQVARYKVGVEKVFRTTEEITNFRYNHWSPILPRGISRPVMLLEFTLDPTIDINTLIDLTPIEDTNP